MKCGTRFSFFDDLYKKIRRGLSLRRRRKSGHLHPTIPQNLRGARRVIWGMLERIRFIPLVPVVVVHKRIEGDLLFTLILQISIYDEESCSGARKERFTPVHARLSLQDAAYPEGACFRREGLPITASDPEKVECQTSRGHACRVFDDGFIFFSTEICRFGLGDKMSRN